MPTTMEKGSTTVVRRRSHNSHSRCHRMLLSVPSMALSCEASFGACGELFFQHSSSHHHHLSTESYHPALAHPQDINTTLRFSVQAHRSNSNSNTTFSSQTQALDQLLQNPLRFVLATNLTSEDEIKMAPVLRPRAIKRNESDGQRNHRLLVGKLLEVYYLKLIPCL